MSNVDWISIFEYFVKLLFTFALSGILINHMYNKAVAITISTLAIFIETSKGKTNAEKG